MATVRFSEDLKTKITSKAEAMFSEREEAAKKNFPPDWAERIYDTMYVDTKDRMLAMPAGYFAMSDDIAFAGFKGRGYDEERDIDVCLEMKEERPFPASTSKKEHGISEDSSRWGMHSLDADDPRWDTVKAEYGTLLTAYHKIVKEREAFVVGVKAVLEAYSTLAPALKAWPALWDLLPSATQDRHRLVVERKKGEVRVGAEVDLNKLTAYVTADKLTR